MKAQILLSAGVLAGLSLIATPALSQQQPGQPGQPGRPGQVGQPGQPGQPGVGAGQFRQTAQMLEGDWEVTIRTFTGAGAGAAGAQAGQEIRGTSSREWILNNNILMEEVRTGMGAGLGGERTGIGQPGQPSGIGQPGQTGAGQPQMQREQIQRQIEQAFTRAGVDRTEAEREAQRLAQQFATTRPTQQQMQQQLQTAMTQAGVEMQEAQRESQQLAQQLHTTIQQQPGAGQPGRTPAAQPGAQPGAGVGLSAGFEGHGMFGYNPQTNEFQHVWCDTNDSKLVYSTGRYDSATRTITFTKDAYRPGTPPLGHIEPGLPDDDDDVRDDDFMDDDDDLQDRPGATGQQPRTGAGQPGGQVGRPVTQPGTTGQINLGNVERIVVRILDDNRHVIEYYGSNGQTDRPGQPGQPGAGQKLMEITYTKSR
jgi:hypothetical protein